MATTSSAGRATTFCWVAPAPTASTADPGSDTVTYAGAAAGVAVSLGAAAAGAGEDTIEGVEVVVGSDGDDTIGGDGAANLLAGMRGDDELAGGGGADTLWGGWGDDMLHGGPGLNRLTGGPGRDRFVFDEESGGAVITDFAGDRIDLTAFGFTRSEFEQYVTIEEERFLIDHGRGGDPREGRRRTGPGGLHRMTGPGGNGRRRGTGGRLERRPDST